MRQTNLNGQGLIEVLMTLLIIVGSVLALLKFQNYLAYSNSLSYQQATATQLAVSEIESLRDYSVLSGSNSYANIASGSASSTVGGATYTTTWTVTSFSNPTYKTLDVSVTWTDRYGTAQSRRLISMVAQIDPSYSATIMAL